MKFKKITYNNYRCFLSGSVTFSEKENQNINLFVGPNGGGKTEVLFSFWWVLYDYEFKKLKNKKNTPYPLNSALYNKLKDSPEGTKESCSVSLEFEYEGTVYVVTREYEYKKTAQRLSKEIFQTLSHYNEVGEKSMPIRDPKVIEKELNRMIPKAILYGIIFDGERMAELSDSDDNSKTAIKGVISDITNRGLIESCITNLKSIKSSLSQQQRSLKSKTGGETLESVVEDLEKADSEKVEITKQLKKANKEKEELSKRCEFLKDELSKNAESKDLAQKRDNEEKAYKQLSIDLDSYYKDFSVTLADSYSMLSNKLIDDVNKLIRLSDIPEGLTVFAVDSILKKDKCICGKDLDDDAIIHLKDLQTLLPPTNVNSSIGEMAKNLNTVGSLTERSLKQTYKYIDKCSADMKERKSNMDFYSTQISALGGEGTSAEKELAARYEAEYSEKSKKLHHLEYEIPDLEDKLTAVSNRIEILQKKRTKLSEGSDDTKKIANQLIVIEKCIDAWDVIKEINKQTALSSINEKLSEAYEQLSEDSEYGRKIRIIQYDSDRMYQMLTYMEASYSDIISKWKKSGEYEKMKLTMSDDEISEKAIISCGESTSTGQSKMNTLSFVKAILDYSNETKDENSVEIKKEYPLVIDAPFSDIAGDNLVQSSKDLHEFSSQIILMLDDDKYKSIEKYLSPYVSNVYRFSKNKNKVYSNITSEKEA